jgi:hypothetical protein
VSADDYLLVYTDADGGPRSLRLWPRDDALRRAAALNQGETQFAAENPDRRPAGHWAVHGLGPEVKPGGET